MYPCADEPNDPIVGASHVRSEGISEALSFNIIWGFPAADSIIKFMLQGQ